MSTAQNEHKVSRITTINRVQIIIALFIAIILCLVFLMKVQMDTLTAIRAFVGAEGLWAKAQKDAILSLERYADTRDEADYQAYRRLLQVPLGDQQARMELQKPEFDRDIVRAGMLQGRNNPADLEYAIDFYRRFRTTDYLIDVTEHWTEGDRLIAELDGEARMLHENIVSGRATPGTVHATLHRLADINQHMSAHEDLFSSTLAEASRWANGIVRRLTYAIAFLAVVLGIILSWPILVRIRSTESALSESEQKFRTITTSAMDAIAMLDEHGKTIFFNEAAEKMFGYPASEILGRDLHMLLSPSRYLDDYRRTYPTFALTGEGAAIGKVIELAALRKDGTEFPVELAVSATRLQGKWAAVGIIRDITQRKRAETEVRELNETLQAKVEERTRQLLATQEELVQKEKLALLGQVAGAVGNELLNPLGVMSNAVFFLQSVMPDADETTREYLNIIHKEIAGSTRIVSDLLDSVRAPLTFPEGLGVKKLVEQTLSECGLPSSVSVAMDIPAAISPLRADRQQMQMVIGKLVSNAVEAMPEGGTLEVAAREDDAAGTVTISIRDSGTGIAPEHLSRLFQPLFTTKSRGIGLGLVVVKNLTEANGGKVDVHSEPGRGAVFSITLPAWQEHA